MFQKIGQWFSNLLKNPAVQKFEEFIKQVFIAEKPIIIAALKDIAVEAVKNVHNLDTLTDDQKRTQAFGQMLESFHLAINYCHFELSKYQQT